MALENFSLIDKINKIKSEPKEALPLVVILLTLVLVTNNYTHQKL